MSTRPLRTIYPRRPPPPPKNYSFILTVLVIIASLTLLMTLNIQDKQDHLIRQVDHLEEVLHEAP